MEFPMIDITLRKPDDFRDHPLIFNKFIFKRNVYQDHYYGRYYCDCTGQVYQVVGHVPTKSRFRILFGFLPGIYKEELVFKPKNKHLELEQIRAFVLEYATGYGDDQSAKDLKERIRAARNVRELLWGF